MKITNLLFTILAILALSSCGGESKSTTDNGSTGGATLTYSWQTSTYGTCSGACGTDNAIQIRTVTCVDSVGANANESQCSTTKPVSSIACTASQCPNNGGGTVVTYTWQTSTYGTCSGACGTDNAIQTRTVTCVDSAATSVNDSLCTATKPISSIACTSSQCLTYSWQAGIWSDCSGACGTNNATKTRTVSCVDSMGNQANVSNCTETMPITEANCTASQCTQTSFSTKEELGEALFFDKNISLTRNTACATCHDPDHAFIDARFLKEGADQSVFINGALSVGDDGAALGGRNSPTISYAMFTPEFTINSAPVAGGQFLDGRASTLKDQAMAPPLDMAEMMMASASDVVARIKENTNYVSAFENLFDTTIFDDDQTAYEAMGEVIAKFEKTAIFAPFDSKYDKYLQGSYTLTASEQRGKDLFETPGNSCRECHLTDTTNASTPQEIFTNFSYNNIGTPKNFDALTAKGLPSTHTDRGLFQRDDVRDILINKNEEYYDGAIRTPTLRNIAVTGPYMQNGVFKKLRTVLVFYNHMGTDPALPRTRNLINPETNQAWGETDVPDQLDYADWLRASTDMSSADIKDLESFLRILTDEKYEHLLEPLED